MGVVDVVKERLDIVDVVSSYVTLKKSGKNFKGLCPFHTEKTPSFIVFPETQTWHCFGACGTGGDVFSFIEQAEGLDFPGALRMLAERAGVELAPRSDAQMQRAEALDRLREINAAAARYFHHLLINSDAGQIAREYLEQRGIDREAWDRFELGYSLNEWDALIRHLTHTGYSLENLHEAGLVVERQDSLGFYDRFRGRLMFPIRDPSGHVIGFGARALRPDDVPKYLNSPQTAIFDKSHVLYGLDRARQAIRRQERVVIVEGYTDVITAHSHGFENVVASLGTALTKQQIALLKRYSRRLVLALDADTAGSEATLRGLEVAKEALDSRTVPVPTASGYIRYERRLDAEIRILVLPVGLDPDEWIRDHPDAWLRRVEAALPVVEYIFNVQTAHLNLQDPKDKSRAVRQLLPVIADIGDQVEQAHYLQKLARMVQVDERVLADQLRRQRPSSRPRPGGQEPASAMAELRPRTFGAEEYLLATLLERPNLLSRLDSRLLAIGSSPLTDDDFTATENRVLFHALREHPTTDAVTLLQRLEAELAAPLVERVRFLQRRLAAEPSLDESGFEATVIQVGLRLRERSRRREIEQLRFLEETAESADDAQTARNRARERAEELRRLHLALGGQMPVGELAVQSGLDR